MNTRDAIRILGDTKFLSPIGQAANVAIGALEKQIPQKVHEAGKCGVSESCPCCKSEVKHAYHYCTLCGQALRW